MHSSARGRGYGFDTSKTRLFSAIIIIKRYSPCSHTSGTCTNHMSPHCLFPWAGKRVVTLASFVWLMREPWPAPPCWESGWGWLTLTSPSKRGARAPMSLSHPGRPQHQEGDFSRARCWVFRKQECSAHGKCPLPTTKINSKRNTPTSHTSCPLES